MMHSKQCKRCLHTNHFNAKVCEVCGDISEALVPMKGMEWALEDPLGPLLVRVIV